MAKTACCSVVLIGTKRICIWSLKFVVDRFCRGGLADAETASRIRATFSRIRGGGRNRNPGGREAPGLAFLFPLLALRHVLCIQSYAEKIEAPDGPT